MKLNLIRHSESNANKRRLVCGQYDSKLTRNGIKIAQNAAPNFKAEINDLIYTSDLSRCIKTAEILFGNTETIFNKFLREIDFGDLNTLKVDTAIRRIPQYRNLRNNTGFVFENGESIQIAYKRVLKFLELIESENKNNFQTIWIVSHGGIINLILFKYLNISLDNFPIFKIDHCSLSSIQIEQDSKIVKFINKCKSESL